MFQAHDINDGDSSLIVSEPPADVRFDRDDILGNAQGDSDFTEPDQLVTGECLLSLICAVGNLERNCQRSLRFIIDSGASKHMFPHCCLLYEVDDSIKGSISR